MPDLWGTLGYDAIASSIAQAFHEDADVNVLQGPPGVGKSWLAMGVGALWENGGGSAIVAEGDLLHSEVALYPLGFAMAGLSSGWSTVVPALTGAAAAGESFVGTAGLITATVQMLTHLRPARRRARRMFLGDSEQAILFQLQRLGRRKPLLLIADNLHWWDPASLELLARLRERRMSDAFPFLANLRVLAVQTTEPYQHVAHPNAHGALLAPETTQYFDLPRIPRDVFGEVLSALGAPPEAAATVAGAVYALSGGHLTLARRCAGRLASGDAAELLAAPSSDDFLRRLLAERMQTLGALRAEAIAMLQVAAVLGLAFRRDELACGLGAADAETARLLRFCRDEDVLELSGATGRFVHDLYRQHFLTADAHEKSSIHERLAGCLRILRPADYSARCLNALDAEQEEDAASLAVQAALQLARDGRSWRMLSAPEVDAIQRGGLSSVVTTLVAAAEDVRAYRFTRVLDSLDRLPHGLPKTLVAEADYLRAMALMSTRSEDDRATGRAILEGWHELWKDEPELGIRLTHLLLYGLTHLADKQPARQLESHLRRVLIDRVGFDPAARDALYTLDRCSGSLYQPDVAVIRNGEAADYYAPEEEDGLARRPLEYYRCLVNLGANLIATGRYREAQDVCGRVDQLVESFDDGVFPRVDYPRMNALLAEYRLGAVTSDEAAERQAALAEYAEAEADPFYTENALAVYLALAGRGEESLVIFDRLNARLTTRGEPEPSMRYLIGANRASVLFLTGRPAEARDDWALLAGVVERIPYVIGPFLVRRHALLADVLGGPSLSTQEFDECLIASGQAEFGPLWNNYGRGFRMPEVEFWREN